MEQYVQLEIEGAFIEGVYCTLLPTSKRHSLLEITFAIKIGGWGWGWEP